jgi:predicted HicB family RNase H-like nuclease
MSATKTQEKPKPSRKGILVKVPSEKHYTIRLRCFEEGISLADWVRDALDRKLATKPKHRKTG